MNRKVKSFKQQCFYRDSVQCQKLQQVFEEQFFGLDKGPQLFSQLVYCAVDNTLFEVSPAEIRCSGASSHYCCYGMPRS